MPPGHANPSPASPHSFRKSRLIVAAAKEFRAAQVIARTVPGAVFLARSAAFHAGERGHFSEDGLKFRSGRWVDRVHEGTVSMLLTTAFAG